MKITIEVEGHDTVVIESKAMVFACEDKDNVRSAFITDGGVTMPIMAEVCAGVFRVIRSSVERNGAQGAALMAMVAVSLAQDDNPVAPTKEGLN